MCSQMLENGGSAGWRESVLSSTERCDYCIVPDIQQQFSEIKLFQAEQAVNTIEMGQFKLE